MRRRALLSGAAALAAAATTATAQTEPSGSTVPGGHPPTSAVRPYMAEGRFENRLDATFGTAPPATIRSKADLDRIAYYRFIYGDSTTTGDGTDGLYKNYRSRHRDYPGNDPRAIHIFRPNSLVLQAHCGLDGGPRTDCSDGHIESAILRFALPIRPGSYIETRCKMPTAPYAWPAFWLNPGEQYPTPSGAKARVGTMTWPPEIDIFDQFGFKDVPPGRALVSGVITNNNDAAYEKRDIFRDPDWGSKWYYQPKPDLTAGFHTYALDWQADNRLRFLLDGHMYLEIHYAWNSKDNVPAHLIASLQIGPKFNDLSGIKNEGDGWNWPIEYVRVWRRTA